MSRQLSLLTSYSAALSKEFEILIEIFKNGVVNKAVCLFFSVLLVSTCQQILRK